FVDRYLGCPCCPYSKKCLSKRQSTQPIGGMQKIDTSRSPHYVSLTVQALGRTVGMALLLK
ncbi:MAG: hypothetical protein AAGJ80_19060, partial [Cyanobacteria bacterium J06553_1]